MDILIECIMELLFEGSSALAASPKVPRWIRYPLIVLLCLFVIGVLVFVGVVGVYLLVRRTEPYFIPFGIVILVMDAVLWMSACFKVRKYLKQRRENSVASNAAKGENE